MALTSSWQRLSITGVLVTSTSLGFGPVGNVGLDSRDITGTRDATVVGNVDVWGVQIETGSTMTSYVPTTSATVTKAADAASFTASSGATIVKFIFDDGTADLNTVTGGATYNIPTTLSRPWILYIDDDFWLVCQEMTAVAQTLGGLVQAATDTALVKASIAQSLGTLGQAATASQGADNAVVAQTLGVLSQAAGAADHCIWSPTDKASQIGISLSGLTATLNSSISGDVVARGTVGGSSGKYFEVTFGTLATATVGIGLANASHSLSAYFGDPNALALFSSGYAEGPGGFSSSFPTSPTFAAGDVMGVELIAGGTAKIYKNGSLAVSFPAVPTGTLYPAIDFGNATGNAGTANFTGPFSYLPSGDVAWDATTISASVAQTLGALGQTATDTARVAAVIAQNLGALTQSAAGTHPDTAAAAQTLGAIVQAATAGAVDTATAAQTLGALSQAATATASDAVVVAQTLGL